jgi:hypothetical protein
LETHVRRACALRRLCKKETHPKKIPPSVQHLLHSVTPCLAIHFYINFKKIPTPPQKNNFSLTLLYIMTTSTLYECDLCYLVQDFYIPPQCLPIGSLRM